MAENKNDIELRSEKVRNIVGKMPSVLIRYGIGIITTVFVLIVAGSFFFRFTPTYNVRAQININTSDTIISIEIPVRLEQYVNVGSRAVVSFDNVPGVENLYVNIHYIDSVMHINQSGTYYYAYCSVVDSLMNKKIETDNIIFVKAQISGVETSLFDYIVEKIFWRPKIRHKN